MTNQPLYIRGWKGLANYLGYHPRTVQEWHLKIARCPYYKTHPDSYYSKWFITPARIHQWITTLEAKGKKIL